MTTPPTARERAHALTEALGLLASREDTEVVTAAILSAQRDERERCAAWCDNAANDEAGYFAARIRALADEETP